MARHFSFLAIAALLILQVAARPQADKDGKACKTMDVKGKYQPVALKEGDKDETYQKIRSEIGYKKGDLDIFRDLKGTVEFVNDGKDYKFVYASTTTKIAPKVMPYKLGVETEVVKDNGLKVKNFFECSDDHLKWSETYENGKVVKYDRVFKDKDEVMEVKMTLDKDSVTHIFKKFKDE